jgi:hypothetical protein
MTSLLPDKDFLASFRQALLRWNRTMSLVSRQDPERVVDRLFAQCVGGGQALWGHLESLDLLPSTPDAGLFYLDLGSGGGLPGIIWHHLFSRPLPATRTCLVEPREKRAWFLRRQNGLAGLPPHQVLEAGWGEGVLDEEAFPGTFNSRSSLLVISLKALHLTDPDVLDGLSRSWVREPPINLVVARYYPGAQALGPELSDHLRLVDGGQARAGWCSRGQTILTWPESSRLDVSLVLSRYSRPS